MSRSDRRPRTPFGFLLYWSCSPGRWFLAWVQRTVWLREEFGDGDVLLGTVIAIPISIALWVLLVFGASLLLGCPTA